jgi:putative transcription factor
MPRCELCGKEVEKLYKVEIEGAIMFVCKTCAEAGNVIEEEKQEEEVVIPSKPEEEERIRVDYAKAISDALANNSISIEDLSRRIGISKDELQKIVNGKIIPEDRIARKLEKILKISLYE